MDFEDNIARYALSVDNSSIGSYPNWDAHLAGGILPWVSLEVLPVPAILVLGVESIEFYTLRVRGLWQLLDRPLYGRRPLHPDDRLEQRKVMGQ